MTSLVPRPESPPPGREQQRWRLIRDAMVFQGKLLLDGARDFLLGPIALLASIIGLLSDREHPRRFFDEVIRLGRRSERWINLFGDKEDRASSRVDNLVAHLEEALRQQVEKGGMTRSAKERIDQWIDAIQAQQKRSKDHVEEARQVPKDHQTSNSDS